MYVPPTLSSFYSNGNDTERAIANVLCQHHLSHVTPMSEHGDGKWFFSDENWLYTLYVNPVNHRAISRSMIYYDTSSDMHYAILHKFIGESKYKIVWPSTRLPVVRQSMLKSFLKYGPPALSDYGCVQKAAFDIGSAVHLFTLEPEREDELIRVVLDCERGDNDWPKPSRTLIYLTQEELVLSRRLSSCFLSDYRVVEWIETGSIEEQILFDVCGASFSSRLDIAITDNGDYAVIVDLKTTSATSLKSYLYLGKKFGYDIQAAAYCLALSKAYNIPLDKIQYRHAVVSKANFQVWHVPFRQSTIKTGLKKLHKGLLKLSRWDGLFSPYEFL